MRIGSFLKQSENVFMGNAGFSCALSQGLGVQGDPAEVDFHRVLVTPSDLTSQWAAQRGI